MTNSNRDIMEKLEEIRRIIKQNKQELEEKFKVKSIAIFGSYIRGEQNEESDVDYYSRI